MDNMGYINLHLGYGLYGSYMDVTVNTTRAK